VNYAQAVAWSDPATKKIPTNRGDGIPDGDFVHCVTPGVAPCTVNDLANVVVVKLYVLARSLETTPGYTDSKTYTLGAATLGPFNDGFQRHVYSTTVRLTNVFGRRETPPL
jgi:type IV pilus assembly protein PilW